MNKKIFQTIKKFWLENYKFLIAFMIVIFLFTFELPYKVYTPGGMVDLKERIEVEEGYSYEGSLGMAYVSMIKGCIPYLALSYFIPEWDIVPYEDIKYENETMEEKIEADKISTQQSVDSAIISAYKLANKEIEITSENVYITYIDEKADTDLKILDQVISVEGNIIKNTDDLKKIILSKKEGDIVSFLVKRENKEMECKAKIYTLEKESKVGISLTVTYNYEEKPEASIKMKSSESGPSGGLMMGLAIYNSLVEEDITKGKKVIGTGTIDIEGRVGEIGGVRYKLIGAVHEKADVFLVPEGNYEEAVKVKNEKGYDIRLISVSTLKEAIEELKRID